VRIIHVFAGDERGGANKGARALMQLQQRFGLDVSEVNLRADRENGIESIYQRMMIAFVKRVVMKIIGATVYMNLFLDLHKRIDLDKYDIIHLHWASGYAGPKFFSRYRQKLVVTMRDEWLLTGGCHYTHGCDGYVNDCLNFPAVSGLFAKKLIQRNFLAKKRSFSTGNIPVTSIGKDLKKIAMKSSVFYSTDITHINNVTEFSAKEVVPESFVYRAGGLMIADNLSSQFKGLDYLIEAARGRKITLVGSISDSDLQRLPENMDYVGRVDDKELLSQYLQRARYLVVPSTAEAFGKIILESFANGTPVVGFPIGEVQYLVDHNQNGALATDIASDALSDAIAIIEQLDDHLYEGFAKNAVKKFNLIQDEREVFLSYQKIYQRVKGS
jgi:glycosyltransferase involved in cell wall biosynthesis